MSAFNHKPRPIEERIAELVGKSTYRTPVTGSGGLPSVTSQDVIAALVWCRKHRDAFKQYRDLAPELLIAKYASDDSHRRILRAAYIRSNPILDGDHKRSRTTLRRMASSVAAQIFSGRKYSREEIGEYAYLAGVRVERFREEVSDAEKWLETRISEALPVFHDALRREHEEAKERGRDERRGRPLAA